MTDVFWACGFVLACLVFYRFGLPWFRQFDARNVARLEREARDKADANAHIRHALEVAEEQVEEVQVITVGDVTHYLFEAQAFVSRDDAEEMRARRIGVVARRFYDELPAALMSRSEPRSNLTARERASQRWKKTIH